MATYLLAHNPQKSDFPPPDWDADLEKSGRVADNWSCGNTKSIRPGDRVFLIRVGKKPCGIEASGWVTSTPTEGPHWLERGRKAFYVDVDWDAVLFVDGGHRPLGVERLKALSRNLWSPANWRGRRSGVRIPDRLARKLEREWTRHYENQTDRRPWVVPVHAGGITGSARAGRYPEGSVVKITVNR